MRTNGSTPDGWARIRVAERVRTLPILPSTDLPLARALRQALPAEHVARHSIQPTPRETNSARQQS